MTLFILLSIPIIGVLLISTENVSTNSNMIAKQLLFEKSSIYNLTRIKNTGLLLSIVGLLLSIPVFLLFNISNNEFQFVQETYDKSMISKNIPYDFFFGLDGVSIYFVLLITIIIPVAILSNWKSIKINMKSFIIILLLLETLLLTVFIVLDSFLFYIFFESILPPLFILIGLFGAKNKVRAGFYLFLYTLLGSLFLLLSILYMSSSMGVSDYAVLFKSNFHFNIQIFIFIGIFIAFAVKTPTIFLNSWLLKAHVESPLGGSIILAAIVLKLSLYGITRLILHVIPKATFILTCLVFVIGIISIIYASLSTLRTVDIKELIAYSSVSHAAVYLLGIFSNILIGIQGAIVLGLAHGFVSSGLFTCGGGTLYERSGTRLISSFRGLTQLMPVFSILFFILCLGNSGTPLTLNFIGEFMCLYGTFEQFPIAGALASSSIVFSAAYSIYMYNRIAFGGTYTRYFNVNFSDVNKREFVILFILVLFTVLFGIYPAPILDGILYTATSLLFVADSMDKNTAEEILAFAYKCTFLTFISTSLAPPIYIPRLYRVNIKRKYKRRFSSSSKLQVNSDSGNETDQGSDVDMSDAESSQYNSEGELQETSLGAIVRNTEEKLDTRLGDLTVDAESFQGNERRNCEEIRDRLETYGNDVIGQMASLDPDQHSSIALALDMRETLDELYGVVFSANLRTANPNIVPDPEELEDDVSSGDSGIDQDGVDDNDGNNGVNGTGGLGGAGGDFNTNGNNSNSNNFNRTVFNDQPNHNGFATKLTLYEFLYGKNQNKDNSTIDFIIEIEDSTEIDIFDSWD